MLIAVKPTDTVTFGDCWHVLGPFQIGTRESAWGADPLEAQGGISNIPHDQSKRFTSSLATNASVTWRRLTCSEIKRVLSVASGIQLHLAFPETDWTMLHQVYGWAALQYQCWIRGTLHVAAGTGKRLLLWLDGVAEYRVDGAEYFGGDLFAFRRAPHVLSLLPGDHVLEIRAVRDVRAMGATESTPSLNITLEAEVIDEDIRIHSAHDIVPDVFRGRIATPYASVSATNLLQTDVVIAGVQSLCDGVSVSLMRGEVVLIGGQTRPIPLRLRTSRPLAEPTLLRFEFSYYHRSSTSSPDSQRRSIRHSLRMKSQNPEDFHKITYVHEAEIVSSSLLRVPQVVPAVDSPGLPRAPILINLHGAGVSLDEGSLRHSLETTATSPYWVLIPSGTTSWAADDWHHWGFSDIQASVKALASWIEDNGWHGPGIITERLVIVGHSNGAQGTYYAVSHWPDLFAAAAPVSGYVSIQDYVPYLMRAETDPERAALVHASLQNYQHALLVPNFAQVPLLLQHGSMDDNVPPYHSRKMFAALGMSGAIDASFFEVPGAGHWFDAIMKTLPLRTFYEDSFERPASTVVEPDSWKLHVVTPAETGSKFGLRVTSLEIYGRIGTINVLLDHDHTRNIQTHNIKSLSLTTAWAGRTVSLDSKLIQIPHGQRVWLTRNLAGSWSILDRREPTHATESDASTKLGSGLAAILHTHGPFCIVHEEHSSRLIAQSIAKNLYQYYSADARIVLAEEREEVQNTGNIIRVIMGCTSLSRTNQINNFPISIDGFGVSLRAACGRVHRYSSDRHGSIGVVFLQPGSYGQLTMSVWGSDEIGLQMASRLSPTFTGVGVPNWVVLGSASRAQGVLGTLAMGFYDSNWNLSPGSYFQ